VDGILGTFDRLAKGESVGVSPGVEATDKEEVDELEDDVVDNDGSGGDGLGWMGMRDVDDLTSLLRRVDCAARRLTS
jgi:hypothetical protein